MFMLFVSTIFEAVLIFFVLFFLLHRFLLPWIIKNYGGARKRNKEYAKKINTINKKTEIDND